MIGMMMYRVYEM